MKRETFIIILDLVFIGLLIGFGLYFYNHIETIERVYGSDVCLLCMKEKGASCVFSTQSTNEYYTRTLANLPED